jgi:hypothetical protein
MEGPDISININMGAQVVDKHLPFQIKQFKDFDQVKYYEPIILERINDELMVQVNNGFDSKYKVFVKMGQKPIEYGKDFSLYDVIIGGGEMGEYYRTMIVQNRETKENTRLKKPGLVNFWFGAFCKKEFVTLFEDNTAFMECYPKPMKRKFQYVPEFFWVYEHKNSDGNISK